MTTFATKKTTHEIVSAREFLRRRRHDPKSVEGAKIVPAPFGSDAFGAFAVKKKTPEYEVILDACP